jgi:hypothetical protein
MTAGFINGPPVVIASLYLQGRGGIRMNAGFINGPSSSRRLSVHTEQYIFCRLIYMP